MSVERVLVWADDSDSANPLNHQDEIDVFLELRRRSIDVEIMVDEPRSRLQPLLARFEPDIFHFIGHGDPRDGALILRDDSRLPEHLNAKQLRACLLAGRDGGPRGVVLNACHSGKSAPTLLPSGGWLIAMDREVLDDAAAAFTRLFYQNLLIDQMEPDEARRRACVDMLGLGYSDADLVQRLWAGRGYGFKRSLKPALTEDYRAAIATIGQALSRGVFRTTAVCENSVAEMVTALQQAATAIGTGQLYERVNPSQPYHVIPHDLMILPGVIHLRAAIAPRLDRVSGVLSRITTSFPETQSSNFYLVANQIDQRGVRQAVSEFLDLLDELDRARNEVLKAVNGKLVEVGEQELRMIPLSSAVWPKC